MIVDTVSAAEATQLARIAKALADPVRVRIVDVLLRRSGDVCQCELQPLFAITQPTLSHHLRTLREAGLIDVDRRGSWAYYSICPERLEAFARWLT